MNILVVGCGSIGKRHIRNLISLGLGEITACDTEAKKLDTARSLFAIRGFLTIEEALLKNKYDAAFICTPPSYHVGQALQLLNHGLHCFIEKPLSNSLEKIDDLIRLADAKKKVVMIGYNLRFSPFLKKIKNILDDGVIGKIHFLRASIGYYLPYWRPDEDYRTGYGSQKQLGGGVVLDASHEIDYIQYLLGDISEVFAVSGKLSNLEIDSEDYAEIILRAKNGVYIQIHLDYLQSNYRRTCEIVGDAGMLLWNLNEGVLKHYSLHDKEFHVYYEGLNSNVNDMYIDEISHYFSCIRTGEEPLISLRDGKRVQEIIVKIKESAVSRQFIPML
jgi:predicted dehydrogenase